MTAVPAWAWVATFGVLAVLIAVDLVLTRGTDSGLRAAASDAGTEAGTATGLGGPGFAGIAGRLLAAPWAPQPAASTAAAATDSNPRIRIAHKLRRNAPAVTYQEP